MRDRPLVYVAGPYTAPDPVANLNATIKLATRLYDSELVVPVVPHLSLLWHLVEPRPVEYWYEYDLHLLRRCDAVLRIQGASQGADREVKEAERLELPVFYNEKSLLDWARTIRIPGPRFTAS